MAVFLRDGKKEGYVFLPPINTQTTLIDTQGMICTEKRNGGHLHGRILNHIFS